MIHATAFKNRRRGAPRRDPLESKTVSGKLGDRDDDDDDFEISESHHHRFKQYRNDDDIRHVDMLDGDTGRSFDSVLGASEQGDIDNENSHGENENEQIRTKTHNGNNNNNTNPNDNTSNHNHNHIHNKDENRNDTNTQTEGNYITNKDISEASILYNTDASQATDNNDGIQILLEKTRNGNINLNSNSNDNDNEDNNNDTIQNNHSSNNTIMNIQEQININIRKNSNNSNNNNNNNRHSHNHNHIDGGGGVIDEEVEIPSALTSPVIESNIGRNRNNGDDDDGFNINDNININTGHGHMRLHSQSPGQQQQIQVASTELISLSSGISNKNSWKNINNNCNTSEIVYGNNTIYDYNDDGDVDGDGDFDYESMGGEINNENFDNDDRHGGKKLNDKCYDCVCAMTHVYNILWFIPILNPVGSFRNGWNVIVSTILLYTCIEIPFTLAFDITLSLDHWTGVFAFCSDLFLLSDIIINFRTSYFDNYDSLRLVTDPQKIAKR